MLDTTSRPAVNGLDLDALDEMIAAINKDHRNGRVRRDRCGRRPGTLNLSAYRAAGYASCR